VNQTERQAHWQNVYATKAEKEVSWFQENPAPSLDLIAATGISTDEAIIDVGAYSLDGACTNWAEEYFSRLRRTEVGIHHHIAGAYLLRYAQESSWPRLEWRSGEPRSRAGDEARKERRFYRLLAAAHC
jgi:ISXO2-like transposase domain